MSKHNCFLRILHKFFGHILTQGVILLGAVFILFMGDLEVCAIPHSGAGVIHSIRNVLFIVFILEFVIANTIEVGYPFSFYFLIDFIDLISLATEVSFVWTPFLQYLDQLSKAAKHDVEFVIFRSQFNDLAGISLDVETIKYLSFFRVIGYLKIMRIAKVIETTKRIRLIVNKTRNSIGITLNSGLRKSSIAKGRRNRLTVKTDIKLALKYLEDFDKFKDDLECNPNFRNSFFSANIGNMTYTTSSIAKASSSTPSKELLIPSIHDKLKIKRQNNKFSTVIEPRKVITETLCKRRIPNFKTGVKCFKGLQLFQSKLPEKELNYLSQSISNQNLIKADDKSSELEKRIKADKIFMGKVAAPHFSIKINESYFESNRSSRLSKSASKESHIVGGNNNTLLEVGNEKQPSDPNFLFNEREKDSINKKDGSFEKPRQIVVDDSYILSLNHQIGNSQFKLSHKQSKASNSINLNDDNKSRRDSWSNSSIMLANQNMNNKDRRFSELSDLTDLSKIDKIQSNKLLNKVSFHESSLDKSQDLPNSKLVQKIQPQGKKRGSFLVSYVPKKLVVPETVKEEEESDGYASDNNKEGSSPVKEEKSSAPNPNHTKLKRSRSNNYNGAKQGYTMEIYNKLLMNNMENKDYPDSTKSLIRLESSIRQKFVSKFTVQVGGLAKKEKNDDKDQDSLENIFSFYDQESSKSSNNSPNKSNIKGEITDDKNISMLDSASLIKKQQTFVLPKSKYPALSSSEQSNTETPKPSKQLSVKELTHPLLGQIQISLTSSESKTTDKENKLRDANSIISVNDESELMKPKDEINFNKKILKQVKLRESLKRIDEDTERNESDLDENNTRRMNSYKSSRPSITSNIITTDRPFMDTSSNNIKETEIKTISSSSESENEIDYDCVPGLEAPGQIKKKRAEQLLIEALLFKNMTVKIVLFKMAIVIGLQLTQYNYIEDIFNFQVPSRIGYCITNFVDHIEKIKANDLSPSKQDYIHSLSYSMTDCFYNMSAWPYNQNNTVSAIVNEFDPDDHDEVFIYINFTSYGHYVELHDNTPEIFSKFSTVLVNEKFDDIKHRFFFNLDYYYSFYYIDDSNYIEFLVDMSYGTFLDKLINVIRSLFVTLIIIITSISLGRDIKSKIMIPATKIINKFRYFFNSETLSYVNILLEKNKDEEEMTMNRKLGQFSYYFDLTVGKRVLNLISQSGDINSRTVPINLQKPGIMVSGTSLFMHVKIETTYDISEAIYDLNRLYSIFHSLSYGFGGDIINESFAVWRSREEMFDLNHIEYSKEISKYCILYICIVGNKGKTNKLLNYSKNFFNFNEYDQSSKYSIDSNLALLCCIELASTLLLKFKKLISKLRNYGIIINFFVFQDNFIYGYVGTPYTYISQNMVSKTKKQVERYFVSKTR